MGIFPRRLYILAWSRYMYSQFLLTDWAHINDKTDYNMYILQSNPSCLATALICKIISFTFENIFDYETCVLFIWFLYIPLCSNSSDVAPNHCGLVYYLYTLTSKTCATSRNQHSRTTYKLQTDLWNINRRYHVVLRIRLIRIRSP